MSAHPKDEHAPAEPEVKTPAAPPHEIEGEDEEMGDTPHTGGSSD